MLLIFGFISEWRYRFYASAQEAQNDRATSFPKRTLFTQQFVNAVNLGEIHLSLDLEQTGQDDKINFMTSWPFWLRGCKALKKITVEIPRFRCGISERVRARNINCLLRQAFKKTGVLGTFVEEIGSSISTADVYIWEAAEGTFMDWSSKIGWEWEEPRASRSDLGRRSAMEEMNARLELRDGADDAYFSLEGLFIGPTTVPLPLGTEPVKGRGIAFERHFVSQIWTDMVFPRRKKILVVHLASNSTAPTTIRMNI